MYISECPTVNLNNKCQLRVNRSIFTNVRMETERKIDRKAGNTCAGERKS